MLKCGIAKFIGLPENPNLKEFEEVYKNKSKFEESMYPITFLAALLYNTEDAMKLHERLKLSAFERDLIIFITQNREKFRDIDDIL